MWEHDRPREQDGGEGQVTATRASPAKLEAHRRQGPQSERGQHADKKGETPDNQRVGDHGSNGSRRPDGRDALGMRGVLFDLLPDPADVHGDVLVPASRAAS